MQRIEDSPSERGRAPLPSEVKWLLKQVGFGIAVFVAVIALLAGMVGPCFPTC